MSSQPVSIEQAILRDTRAIRQLMEPKEGHQMTGAEMLIEIQSKVLDTLEQIRLDIQHLHQRLNQVASRKGGTSQRHS